MEINRREFTALAGAALLAARTSGVNAATSAVSQTPALWHQRIKRIGQVNFNERDARDLNVDAWVGYLVDAKVQAVMLSVTGMVAFYPTSVPDFPVSPYLQGRDVFGECCRAAHDRGIKVIGRLSPDLASIALSDRHPEWFRRDAEGRLGRFAFGLPALMGSNSVADPSISPGYAPTCQFTSYFADQIPAIVREILQRYEVDGIYANGWPGVDAPLCYCAACRKMGDPTTETYKEAYLQRSIELWKMFLDIVQEKDSTRLFTGNLGGGFRGGDLDLKRLTASAPWFTADNQGRGPAGTPTWGAAQQVRIGNAIMKGRTVVNVTGAYTISGSSVWRNVTGNRAEVELRMMQTAAAGGTNWYHWLGFQQGFIEDRRWQQVGREFLSWQAAHDPHFHNVRSLARVAVLLAPRSNRLYKAPPGSTALEAIDGTYAILNEARIPFDLVHEDDLGLETLKHYSLLILSNVALLSDTQSQQIEAYVASGGSLVATFETGLYDETGKPRAEFALAELYAMRKVGERDGFGRAAAPGMPASAGPNFLQRIERSHEITHGFEDTHWLAGSPWRVPIQADGDAVLTCIAPYPVYPTEAVYSPQPHTREPTVVLREHGASRLAYFSGDLDATYWRSGDSDLAKLITNAIDWALRDDRPLQVTGDGLIEIFGWRTEPGYAVHLLNYTNPNFRGGMFRQHYPIGAQRVRMTMIDDGKVRRARLLRADADLAFVQHGRTVDFTVPRLLDYELAALET